MNEENKKRNSKNTFELEGNVANIYDIYTSKTGKKSLRFDLGQNNNDNSQFVPIIIKGNLVNTYGQDIKKGQWITIKGRIDTYTKEVERNEKTYNEKAIEILGFEITDRTNNKIYSSNGDIKSNSKNERGK